MESLVRKYVRKLNSSLTKQSVSFSFSFVFNNHAKIRNRTVFYVNWNYKRLCFMSYALLAHFCPLKTLNKNIK